jgi:hypothetical protein
MKKTLLIGTFIVLSFFALNAQSDDELFGGDDLFFEDMITEISEEESQAQTETALSLTFSENTVKFGGSLYSSVSAKMPLYNGSEWGNEIGQTTLTPELGTDLYFDARPKENLRLYGKFGIALPFTLEVAQTKPAISVFPVKELFTDFSFKDRVFFRFGKHSVKWGTGYFFSPADIINTGVIDPENPTADVEGSINLRSQIIFPGTQNCLWLYIIPKFSSIYNPITKEMSVIGFAKNTAFAGKYEFLVNNYEIGFGAWYAYENPLRISLTASGSLGGKVGVFAETVFIAQEYETFGSVFIGTIGFSQSFSKTNITVASQYLFDNSHALALSFSKSKLGSDKVSLSLFGLVHYPEESFENFELDMISVNSSLSFSYSVASSVSISAGPYWNYTPATFLNPTINDVGLKISTSLGGGKF